MRNIRIKKIHQSINIHLNIWYVYKYILYIYIYIYIHIRIYIYIYVCVCVRRSIEKQQTLHVQGIKGKESLLGCQTLLVIGKLLFKRAVNRIGACRQ